MRDGNVDMNAVALWTRDFHPLELKARASTGRVEQVIVADLAVTEQRAPERKNVSDDECVDRDVHELDGGRVGRDAQRLRGSRDLPRQRYIARLQAHRDACAPKVDIEILFGRAGEPADLVHERHAFAERASP